MNLKTKADERIKAKNDRKRIEKMMIDLIYFILYLTYLLKYFILDILQLFLLDVFAPHSK